MPAPTSDGDRAVERSHEGGDDPAPRSGPTRRSVLAGAGATLGTGVLGAAGLAGASGPAAAQVTEAAAIPEVTRWENDNIAGFMIHVGASTSPAEVRVAEDCDVPGSDTWPPDEMLAYKVHIINRKVEETPEAETTLYISDSAEVAPGTLYIVNRFNRCGSGFVGVTLEQIGRADVGPGRNATGDRPVADVEEDERPNVRTTAGDGSGGSGGFGAVGPGFDAVAAVAGLLGGGALLRRRGDDGD